MMKRKSNYGYGRMRENSMNTSSSRSMDENIEWEMRPCGMLVQKRTQTDEAISAPDIRLRVVFGEMRCEISVNSQATFGEVKKRLTEETGLQAGQQRLAFKGKERQNGEFLDMCGVKNGSKLVATEDPASVELRFIEMQRNAKIQTAHRAINDVSMELDQLADQVYALEKSISSGVKVAEIQITTLNELLMKQAIRLDNIDAEGEAFSQKILQGKRVQKYVETLDTLKISNGRVKHVIATTSKWEIFDPSPVNANAMPRWEVFD